MLTEPSKTGHGEVLEKTAPIRARAIELVRGTTWTQAAIGLAMGLLLPLAGLTLLGLLGSLVVPSSRYQDTDRPKGEAE